MKTLAKTPAPFERGESVLVSEENIRPWHGDVAAVKWSPRSGWWIDVRREEGGYWVVPSAFVSSRKGGQA